MTNRRLFLRGSVGALALVGGAGSVWVPRTVALGAEDQDHVMHFCDLHC